MSRQRTKTAPNKAKKQSQFQANTSVTANGSEAPAKPKSNAETLASQEAKREARMQKQDATRVAAERRRRIKTLRNIAIIAGVVLLLGGGLALYLVNEANKPGQGVAQEYSPHITDLNTAHAPYSTEPPTSGPHVKETAGWGVHTEAVPKEKMVHSLEDSGVVISYKPDLDKAIVDKLAELTRSYDTDVLLAPYPGLSDPIVLTAWTRIDRLGGFDEPRIKRFINAFKGKDHHSESGS